MLSPPTPRGKGRGVTRWLPILVVLVAALLVGLLP